MNSIFSPQLVTGNERHLEVYSQREVFLGCFCTLLALAKCYWECFRPE